MLDVLFQITLIVIIVLFLYLMICLCIILILAKLPRNSMTDQPDWGEIQDIRVPTVRRKFLECWIVKPTYQASKQNNTSFKKHAIILLHGWGRNRGRMVSRARIYGEQGYTTILFSARDHGNSDGELTGMNIIRFTQDLNAIVKWWGQPVIVCGHSIGAGAALIAGSNNLQIKGIIAESPPYAFPFSLKDVYKPALLIFTPIFLPGITFLTIWFFRRFQKGAFSPADVAPQITIPTLIIHGKYDEIFPYKFSESLSQLISDSIVWIPEYGTHSNLEQLPDYEQRVIDFLKKNKL